MANAVFYPELAGADPCKFCGSDFLFFNAGAVACDNCQAEGPFCGHQFMGDDEDHERRIEAVRLWNRTPADWDQTEDGIE